VYTSLKHPTINFWIEAEIDRLVAEFDKQHEVG
jgi:hypothetical protein